MLRVPKIGLALGAGGARGLAHVGVLKALEEAGVGIDYLTGTSIGAVVGAAWAAMGDAAAVHQRLDEFYESGLAKESGFSLILETAGQQPEAWHEKIEIWIKRAYVQARFVSRQTVLDSRVFRQLIEFFIPKMNIEDLPLPFAAVSTDLNSGRPVLFKTGPLRAAVYASAAIPGLVMPLSYEDMLLVDGGVLHLVPVLAARTMGADAVVASSVDQPIDLHRELNTALDLLFRVEEVQNTCLMKQHLLAADLVVKPETDRVHWSDFDHADELIQAGHNTTAMLMDRIVALKRRRLAFRRPGPAGVLAPMREWIVI